MMTFSGCKVNQRLHELINGFQQLNRLRQQREKNRTFIDKEAGEVLTGFNCVGRMQ